MIDKWVDDWDLLVKDDWDFLSEFGFHYGCDFGEMAFSIDKICVTAKARQLKAEYTIEIVDDIQHFHPPVDELVESLLDDLELYEWELRNK